MAYGEIYRIQFQDVRKKTVRVSIEKNGYSGSYTELIADGESPVRLTAVTQNQISNLVAEVRIRNTFSDRFLFIKMVQETYLTYRATITYDGGVEFKGYLLPTTYSQHFEYKDLVVLTFSFGLKNLQYMYPDILTDTEGEYRSVMEYLISIFNLLQLDYKIYVNSSLYEDNMSSSEQGDNPLLAIYLHRYLFFGNDGKKDTALIVLEKILMSINAVLYVQGNTIFVERFVDRKKSTKTWWTYDSLTSSYGSQTESSTYVDLDSLQILNGGIQYQVEPPLKLYKLYLKPCVYTNITTNDFVNHLEKDSFYSLYKWTYDDSYIKVFANPWRMPNIQSGIYLTKADSVTLDDYYAYGGLRWGTIITNADDDITISIRWKHYLYVSDGDELAYRYAIRLECQGNPTCVWWVDSNGDLQSSFVQRWVVSKNNTGGAVYDHELADTIDLSGKLDAVGLTGDIYLYLLIKPPCSREIGVYSPYVVRDYRMGDVVLSISNNRITNYKIGDLNIDAFAEKEETVSIFDTGMIHYFNSPTRKTEVAPNDHYYHTNSWTDDLWTSKTLQEHLMLNKSNYYASPIPKFQLTIVDRSQIYRMRDLFYTSYIKNALGSDMYFYMESFSWDMKNSKFNVRLKKWESWAGLT